jgi:hypothetical protein
MVSPTLPANVSSPMSENEWPISSLLGSFHSWPQMSHSSSNDEVEALLGLVTLTLLIPTLSSDFVGLMFQTNC